MSASVDQTLSQEQIDALFAFTKKKYVQYYDIQLELVDHLATEIEHIMSKYPNKSFDGALSDVYKSFGIFGFAKIREQKAKEMSNYWRARIRHYLLRYFKWPKVGLTMLLAFLFYNLLRSFDISQIMGPYAVVGMYSIFVFLLIWMDHVTLRKKKYKSKQPLILVDSFNSYMINVSLFIFYPIQFLTLTHTHSFFLILNSFLFAIGCILLHGAIYTFPHWLEEEIGSKYAHLNIS